MRKTEFKGIVVNGCKDASSSWNFTEIKRRVGDDAVFCGTINIKLDRYAEFEFRCDIDFPDHVKCDGRQTPEGLQFEHCLLHICGIEKAAYVAKTVVDYWGRQNVVEVIAPRFDNAPTGTTVVLTVSN